MHKKLNTTSALLPFYPKRFARDFPWRRTNSFIFLDRLLPVISPGCCLGAQGGACGSLPWKELMAGTSVEWGQEQPRVPTELHIRKGTATQHHTTPGKLHLSPMAQGNGPWKTFLVCFTKVVKCICIHTLLQLTVPPGWVLTLLC